MKNPGPQLEVLTRRLAETPVDFLQAPKVGGKGQVFVPALLNDLLWRFGSRRHQNVLTRYAQVEAKTGQNHLALLMITVWLLSDDWFVQAAISPGAIVKLLDVTMAELAAIISAPNFVSDPDRREELVRVILAQLQFRPAGETVAQATDRLSSLSSLEQKRLLAQSRGAEERARAIRAALVKKAAEESADKWTRE